jgi:hypothetical protein
MRCSNCIVLAVCEDEVLCCVNGIGAFDELYRIAWTEGRLFLTGSFCCTFILQQNYEY